MTHTPSTLPAAFPAMSINIDPEFASLIPALSPEERAQLEENIKRYGCRDPLTTWGETLLDGHNRYEICTRLGLPYATVSVAVVDREAAMDWIDANQLGRRNLTPDAFRLLLGRRYNRQKKTTNDGGKGTPKATVDQIAPRFTADKLADQYAVSAATVKRAGKFAEQVARTPELQKAIEENRPVAQVQRTIKRAERVQNIVEVSKGNTELGEVGARFAVVYADPPWRYEYSKSDSRAIENQYPTMSLEELQQMPVADICTDDCVLFLWATSPKLDQALDLLSAWGFSYRTCAVWDKQKIGMGYYFRQRHELLLVATRGNPPTPEPANRPASVFSFPRGEHSAKPAEVADMIAAMYPDLPKVEMFARSARESWSVWGNQAHV